MGFTPSQYSYGETTTEGGSKLSFDPETLSVLFDAGISVAQTGAGIWASRRQDKVAQEEAKRAEALALEQMRMEERRLALAPPQIVLQSPKKSNENLLIALGLGLVGIAAFVIAKK